MAASGCFWGMKNEIEVTTLDCKQQKERYEKSNSIQSMLGRRGDLRAFFLVLSLEQVQGERPKAEVLFCFLLGWVDC